MSLRIPTIASSISWLRHLLLTVTHRPLLSTVDDAVGANSRVVKQGGAFGRRVGLGEPLEAVEQDVMGERYLIDREVALEHAAVGAELLDAVAHDRSDRPGQLFRADGPRPCVPIETQSRHADSA